MKHETKFYHTDGNQRIDQVKIQQGVKLILQGMGVDVQSSHFRATPRRVAKLYAELLTPPENNWTEFKADTQGMIILRNHRVFALCPHHLQVVELKAFVAYIPRKKMLGLSKLARVVEQHLTRPITQEELGELVANTLDERMEPQGVAVVLQGAHGCMRYRGIETTGDVVSSAMRGLFLHSVSTREEFLSLIGRP